MRVNSKVFTERMDMLDGIRIPNCPSSKIGGKSLRLVCENIMNMAMKPGYAPPSNYHNMTELDKRLMLDYWREYDDLHQFVGDFRPFDEWFIHKATSSEVLRRAREWLGQHNYLIFDNDVVEHAQHAGRNMRQTIRQ